MFAPLTTRMRVLTALCIVAAALAPLLTKNSYVLHVLILAMIYAVFASSWNFVTGFAGLKTFGHHAFFGLGAYLSALFSMRLGLSPWLTMPLGAVVAAVVGAFIGLPILRIKSMPHVAIVTLGFAEIVRITLSNLSSITQGERGLWGIPALPDITFPGLGALTFSPVNKLGYYYVALCLLVCVVAAIAAIMRSRMGLTIIAMRDAEPAAESLGVNLVRNKLLVFAVSAFFVGLAGGFYAHYTSILTPSAAVGADIMILVIAMTLVGGLGTFSGPILGALTLTVLTELMRDLDSFRLLIYGAVLIVAIMFMPKGIVNQVKSASLKLSSKKCPHAAP